MALQISFDAGTGSKYPKAYCRVVQVNVSWIHRRASVVVYIFRNEASRQADEEPVGHVKFAYSEPPEVEEGTVSEFEMIFGLGAYEKKTNLLEVVYNHIKTEEIFGGSQDV